MRGRTARALALAAMATTGAQAQEPLAPGAVVSPILTVDQEDLFTQSAFGRRIRAELEEASRALAAENRRMEAELTAEERTLTDRRGSLSVEAGLMDMLDRMQSGKFKVYNHLAIGSRSSGCTTARTARL